MERAAAGEEFRVTRRGKPYVRLGPAEPRQLTMAGAANPEPNGSAEPPSEPITSDRAD